MVLNSQVMCTWQPLSMSPIRGSTTEWFLIMLRTMRDVRGAMFSPYLHCSVPSYTDWPLTKFWRHILRGCRVCDWGNFSTTIAGHILTCVCGSCGFQPYCLSTNFAPSPRTTPTLRLAILQTRGHQVLVGESFVDTSSLYMKMSRLQSEEQQRPFQT